MNSKKDDKSTWAIGGGTLIGIGVGLLLHWINPMAIPAFTLIGVGMGLLISSLLSRKKR